MDRWQLGSKFSRVISGKKRVTFVTTHKLTHGSDVISNRKSTIIGWVLLCIGVKPLIENLWERGSNKRVRCGHMKSHKMKGHKKKVIDDRNRNFVTCDILKVSIESCREKELQYEGLIVVTWRAKGAGLNTEGDWWSQVLDGETKSYIIKFMIVKSQYYKGPSTYYVVPCSIIFLMNRPTFPLSPKVLFQKTIIMLYFK